jgi:hypothetical protein
MVWCHGTWLVWRPSPALIVCFVFVFSCFSCVFLSFDFFLFACPLSYFFVVFLILVSFYFYFYILFFCPLSLSSFFFAFPCLVRYALFCFALCSLVVGVLFIFVSCSFDSLLPVWGWLVLINMCYVPLALICVVE